MENTKRIPGIIAGFLTVIMLIKPAKMLEY